MTTSMLTKIDSEKVPGKVDEYLKFFDQSKPMEGQQQLKRSRMSQYTTLINNYYDLVTDFYEYGWGESFHFAPRFNGESFDASLARHEHFLALRLKLEPGMRVLDIGCGVGGPLRSIARFANVKVDGVNNNAYQISRGTKHNQRCSDITHLCNFIKADYMHLPIENDSYDAAYAIESTCHAPDRVACYQELKRVIKPGAYFTIVDWAMTSDYDPNNAWHNEIKWGIEEGNAIPNLIGTDETLEAMKAAGFEICEVRDLCIGSQIPWYQPLAGGVSLEGFRHTRLGRWCTQKMVDAMEFMRIAPKGSSLVSKFLSAGADYLVEGGKLNIFTPALFILARKPLAK